MSDSCRTGELTVAFSVATKLVVPAVMDVANSDSYPESMQRAAIHYKNSPIRPDRKIDRDVEAATANVGTKADRIEVVEFGFHLGSHSDLNELVFPGSDDQLK